jgi:hypothetical protein
MATQSLLQFGMGSDRFVFATYPKLYQLKLNPASFDDMEFSSMSLPGMDGVFPTNPFSRGRTTSTTISLKFKYAGDESTDWVALKKAIRKPQSHGLTYLFKQMEDGTVAFTLATCTRAYLNPDADSQVHIFRDGQLDFFCPKARWYSKTGLEFLDSGLALDSDLTLLGPQIDRVTVNSGDVIEVTNNGDAPAGILIWAEAPTGESVTDFSLSRMSVDGVSLADSIAYNDTFSDGDAIILDSRNHQAQLNYSVIAASGYGNVEALRATWLELPPGDSELIVGGTFTNGAIVSLEWYDTWF